MVKQYKTADRRAAQKMAQMRPEKKNKMHGMKPKKK